MLDNFLKYVQYMEEEMAKDIGKLYIGDKVMMDISKC